MSRKHFRLISVILAVMLVIAGAPLGVYAAEKAVDNQGILYIKSDDITFKKSYFQQSSYTNNIFLAKLSVQTALTSLGYYDLEKDPFRTDPSMAEQNLINLLTDKGFRDVKTNQYYSIETRENSMGVVVGRMTVKQKGKKYTLLAVVPRSENYYQEWVGNFEVGERDIHSGFKAGRDEVLRFIKKYIQDNNITGNLKIWISGHSRGAAVANMVGGFLAGGGNAYLGNNVRIKPKNIYCYCFAVPCLIKEGTSKTDELSVAGARDGRYASDTEGEAFTYSGEGTVDPRASIYNGIKTFTQPEDMVTKLPCAQWGLTYYGTVEGIKGKASWSEMMAQLKTIEPEFYEDYSNGANPEGFARYTFDLASLKLVPDQKRQGESLGEFFDKRVDALNELISSNAYYVESGYQDALAALGGVYGLLLSENPDYVLGDQDIDTSALIKPMVLTYLAYISEQIQEDYEASGSSISEADAVAIWLGNFAKSISGLNVPKNPTADFIVLAFTEFIAQNPNSELSKSISKKLAGNLSDSDRLIIRTLTLMSKWNSTSDEDMVKNALIACARGPAKGTPASLVIKDAASVRQRVYGPLSNMLGQYPELAASIDNGNGSLTGVAAAIIATLATRTDGNGNMVTMSLGDAADAELAETFGDILYKAAETIQELYGAANPDYYADACRHIETVLDHITLVRHAISYLLLYSPEDSSGIESTLSNACTLACNINMVKPAHFCESYVAWMCARTAKLQDIEVKVPYKAKVVKRSTVAKKERVLSVIKVKGAKGKVKYKKQRGSAKLSVNAKNGKIIVKKGTKMGLYKIRVKVTACKKGKYKAAKKVVTVKVRVK